MNRIEAVSFSALAALVGAAVAHQHRALSRLAATPDPVSAPPVVRQHELRPVATLEAAVQSYLAGSKAAEEADRAAHLSSILGALESPEFAGEELDPVSAEALARVVVEALAAVEGSAQGPDLRRRAAAALARRVGAPSSKSFVLAALEEGPQEVREAALAAIGFAGGVRGPEVHAKVVELQGKGLVPDRLLPQALRRTGGRKARQALLDLMASTDSARLVAGCAVALQDYREPDLLGPALERLEALGLLTDPGRLPWLSAALLDAHLKDAGEAQLRRGLAAIATRPSLISTTLVHVERGLQGPDLDARRHAAVAVKKAVVAGALSPEKGEELLAGRLVHETEPVLKAELTGGLERVRGILGQAKSGVQ
jgi:hypothetical protein